MNYICHILVVISIYTTLSISLDIIVGQCGRLSVCQAAFFGIGAFTSSILLLRFGWSYTPAAIAAAISGGTIAACLAVVVLRFHEDVFALATIGFQVIAFSIMYNCIPVTGGPSGLPGVPRPTILGLTLVMPGAFLALSSLIAVLAIVLYSQLIRSPFGRSLRAIRDDRIAAMALGKNIMLFETSAMAISGALAAIAGSLWATWAGYIDATDFGLDTAILILSIVIIGGPGGVQGPIAGAVILSLLPEILRFFGVSDIHSASMRQVVYGIVLILLMRFRRHGICGQYAIE